MFGIQRARCKRYLFETRFKFPPKPRMELEIPNLGEKHFRMQGRFLCRILRKMGEIMKYVEAMYTEILGYPKLLQCEYLMNTETSLNVYLMNTES